MEIAMTGTVGTEYVVGKGGMSGHGMLEYAWVERGHRKK
jgi:hypothetical protein